MGGDIIGWVGLKPGRIVGGWAANAASSGTALTVRVTVGDWTSEPLAANEYRQHLNERNIGTAWHGFSVSLPDTLNLSAGQQIVVTVDDHPGARITARVPKDYGELRSRPREMSAEEALRIVANGGLPARKKMKSLDDLLPFAGQLLESPKLAHLLRDAGRALLRQGDSAAAARLIGAARALNPDNSETMFQYAVAVSRAGRQEEALSIFRTLRDHGHRPSKTLSEFAQALRRALNRAGHERAPALEEEMAHVVKERLAMDDTAEGILPASIALTLSRCGMVDLAERALAHTATLKPGVRDVSVVRMRLLIETGRMKEGLDAARELLSRWPEDEAAAHILRAYRHLESWQAEGDRIATLCRDPNPSLAAARMGASSHRGSLDRLLRTCDADWIALAPHGSLSDARLAELRARLRTASGAGCLQMPDGLEIWKAAALADLTEADLLRTDTFDADLDRARPFYLRPADLSGRTTALLISRYGINRFGGAEHFLQAAAEHYAGLGYQSLVLGGIDKKPADLELDPVPGLRFDFVEMTPTVLRRRILEENVGLVHALSGTGFLMAAALGDMNVPFVYGMHYFREVLGADGDETYFDNTGMPIRRPDFEYLLSRASVVYANSTYSRDLIEKAHGVRCPVIYSVPEERAQ